MLLGEQMASTAAMRQVFSATASVQAMLAAEAGLTRAGAACGLVPGDVAARIVAVCAAGGVDTDKLAAEGQLAGTVVVPLVAWLRAQMPEGQARYVHVGGTSQDIIDTGLVLQLRAGVVLLQDDLARMAQAAVDMVRDYASTPMMARTLLQAALPSRFGLKAAYWLAAIDDARAAMDDEAAGALVLQCGGAAGTLDAVAGCAEAFMAAFGAALGLAVPPLPWHTRRAPLLRLAAAMTGAVGVAGKIGTDIALLMQNEINEVREPAAPGRGKSSAMAHKRNPTLSIAARAASLRMPGYLAALAGAQMQAHERAAGELQAEAAIWPGLMLCASGAMAAMAEAMGGLEVDAAAMQRNVPDMPGAGAGAADMLVMRALAAHEDFETTLKQKGLKTL
ncbi:MAG: lyase family protein [Acidocella sp.]|nr:lyase family protein [Acidocella sp.]